MGKCKIPYTVKKLFNPKFIFFLGSKNYELPYYLQWKTVKSHDTHIHRHTYIIDCKKKKPSFQKSEAKTSQYGHCQLVPVMSFGARVSTVVFHLELESAQ